MLSCRASHSQAMCSADPNDVALSASLAGWSLLLRRILKPIGAVREAMEAAEKGNPTKIDIHGEHEIWSLATEYNALLDALDQQKRKAEQGGGSKACRYRIHKCVRIWRNNRLDGRDSNRVGELSI